MKLNLFSPAGEIRPKCECCCREYATRFEPNPYDLEINGITDNQLMCEECYYNACDDI